MLLIGWSSPNLTSTYYQTEICYTFVHVKYGHFREFVCLFYIFQVYKNSTIKAFRLKQLCSLISYNIHLILESFVGLIYMRVIPCTTLDPKVELHISHDVNVDWFVISLGLRKGALALASGEIIPSCTFQQLIVFFCQSFGVSLSHFNRKVTLINDLSVIPTHLQIEKMMPHEARALQDIIMSFTVQQDLQPIT